MNNGINSNQAFTSSFVPKSFYAGTNKTMSDILKGLDPYFTHRGCSANKPVNELRNLIGEKQSLVNVRKDGLQIIGKTSDSDKLISDMLTQSGVEHTYVNDFPKTGNILDTTV